jgi:hypothetical protein
MSRIEHVVDRCDGLYASVVADPDAWPDHRLAEWAGELFIDGEPPDKETRKHLRAVIRVARKLRAFWSDDSQARPDDHGDWESKVDIALGSRAWRPVLDLAMHGLATSPSPELFESVKERFAVVTSQRWMEGVDYEEWLADR